MKNKIKNYKVTSDVDAQQELLLNEYNELMEKIAECFEAKKTQTTEEELFSTEDYKLPNLTKEMKNRFEYLNWALFGTPLVRMKGEKRSKFTYFNEKKKK